MFQKSAKRRIDRVKKSQVRKVASLLAQALRGRANRSRSAGGSGLPAVTSPGFSDEPPDDDDHLRKRDPEVDHPPPPFGAPDQLLVGVMPGVRPLHDPAQTGSERGGLALLRDHPDQLPFLQESAGDIRIVAAVEVYAHRLRRQPQRLRSVEGGSQKWGVVTIGRS